MRRILGRRTAGLCVVIAGVLAGGGVLAAPSPAAPALKTGFFDVVFTGTPAERAFWFQRTVDSASDIVRIQIGWAVPDTPERPPGFDATNPADPSYVFATADAAVKSATERGLDVMLSFTGAPRWAEGPDRPADARPGTWRPDPSALRDYGIALGRRYSGSFPDPAQPGRSLPRVRNFQVWNEPNLSLFLTPQWSGSRTAAPAHYRRMLNAFYEGVKSVRPDALVVSAGTAPFGGPSLHNQRIRPVRFVRDLLCVRRGRGRGGLRRSSCPHPARFDVLAHHPYTVGKPFVPALNRDDASVADMHEIRDVLRFAERSGSALPRERRQHLWVTEFAYDSSPPDPYGVPLAAHARFLAQALFSLSKQGVDTVIWLRIVDQLPEPSFAATNQSGVYFRDGRPKPAQRAFRFPFVVQRSEKGVTRVWGRSPTAGRVVIELLSGGRWRRVRALKVARRATFEARVARVGHRTLRARIGAERSLPVSYGHRFGAR
ncbi:MAG: hypothetical protein ACR2NB_01560 [Solirubrobacteraceae bacterium]